MTSIATDLEWGYEPADFFEAPSTFMLEAGILTIDNGKAYLRLQVKNGAVPAEIRQGATAQVAGVFDARRLLAHRSYSIRGPDVIRHQTDGKRHISVHHLEGAELKVSCGLVDVIVTSQYCSLVRNFERLL